MRTYPVGAKKKNLNSYCPVNRALTNNLRVAARPRRIRIGADTRFAGPRADTVAGRFVHGYSRTEGNGRSPDTGAIVPRCKTRTIEDNRRRIHARRANSRTARAEAR